MEYYHEKEMMYEMGFMEMELGRMGHRMGRMGHIMQHRNTTLKSEFESAIGILERELSSF